MSHARLTLQLLRPGGLFLFCLRLLPFRCHRPKLPLRKLLERHMGKERDEVHLDQQKQAYGIMHG